MSQTTIELHKAYAQKQHNKYHLFSPFAKSYVKDSLTQYYRCLEQDKKHAYEARVREVELGCFAPLVFSTSGGLHVGPAAKTVHRRLAALIAEKHDQPYSLTPFWLHGKLSFLVATFCNHVSLWLKIVIPSRRLST